MPRIHRCLGRLRRRKRRGLLYTCGTFSFTCASLGLLPDQPLHELGELQKIRDPEDPSPPAEDKLRIGRDDIRPVPRD